MVRGGTRTLNLSIACPLLWSNRAIYRCVVVIFLETVTLGIHATLAFYAALATVALRYATLDTQCAVLLILLRNSK